MNVKIIMAIVVIVAPTLKEALNAFVEMALYQMMMKRIVQVTECSMHSYRLCYNNYLGRY